MSYNLKKLVESGYIHHQRSRTDKRSVRVKLTDKGKAISEMVNRLLERQLNMLEKVGGVSVPDLKHFNQISVKLERFWDRILPALATKAALADNNAASGLPVTAQRRLTISEKCYALQNNSGSPPVSLPFSYGKVTALST